MGAFFSTQDLLAHPVENYVWDVDTMSWVKETQVTVGGGITVGTVDQGTGGSSAWLVKLDQTGSNNNVDISTMPAITGTVSVSNLPATQPVSGTVAVSNFPSPQTVSGTVTANQGAAGTAPWLVIAL